MWGFKIRRSVPVFATRLLGLAGLGVALSACTVSMIQFDPFAAMKVANTPTAFTAKLGSYNGVMLSWSTISGAVSYTVSRTETPGSGYVAIPACTKVTTNSCVDNTAIPDTDYYYSVTATNIKGESLPSAEVSSRVPTYVVSPSGNDANLGTQAAPFLTIQHAVDTAQPGESIGIRAGTYRETVTMVTGGTTMSSYGDDAQPVISGADLLTGWTLYSGSIYSISLASAPTQVFSDDTFIKTARYPASGYNIIDMTPADNHSLTDSALMSLSGAQDPVGAFLIMRTNNFTLEGREITSFTGADTLGWAVDTGYTPDTGYGYYMENKLWMMTAPGSWAYDAGTTTLYVWLPDSSNPNTHKMEASIRPTVYVNSNDNVLKKLTLDKSSRDTGLSLYGALTVSWGIDNTLLDQLSVTNSFGNSVDARGTSHTQITNSTILNSVNDAIYADYSSDVSVIGNTITNSGTVGSPRNSYAAIAGQDSTTNFIVKDNVITNAGYNGITFYYGAVVQHNTVINPCQVLSDCGGIYAFQVQTNGMGDTFVDPYGAVVDGNTVTGALGNFDGTPNKVGAGYPGAGVYLDLQADGITVTNNTLYGNETGFFQDNASSNVVSNNTIYSNLTAQMYFDEFQVSGSMNSNTVTGNTLVATNAKPILVMKGSFSNINFGTFNNNHYSSLYNNQVITETYKPATVMVHRSYTLTQWQNLKAQESTGNLVNAFTIAPYKTSAPGADLITNGDLETNFTGWGAYSDGTGSASRSTSCANGTVGCIGATTGTDVSIYSNNFSVTSGTHYLLQFDAKLSSGTLESVNPFLEMTGSPYTYFSIGTTWTPVTPTWATTQLILDGTGSGAGVSLFLALGENTDVLLDKISLKPVTVTDNDFTADSKILVNSTAAAKSMTCPDAPSAKCSQYLYTDGSSVTFPVSVPAYSSKVIIWTASTFRNP